MYLFLIVEVHLPVQFRFRTETTFFENIYFDKLTLLVYLHPIHQYKGTTIEQYVINNANNPLYHQQTQRTEVIDKVNYKNNANGICVSNCI